MEPLPHKPGSVKNLPMILLFRGKVASANEIQALYNIVKDRYEISYYLQSLIIIRRSHPVNAINTKIFKCLALIVAVGGTVQYMNEPIKIEQCFKTLPKTYLKLIFGNNRDMLYETKDFLQCLTEPERDLIKLFTLVIYPISPTVKYRLGDCFKIMLGDELTTRFITEIFPHVTDIAHYVPDSTTLFKLIWTKKSMTDISLTPASKPASSGYTRPLPPSPYMFANTTFTWYSGRLVNVSERTTEGRHYLKSDEIDTKLKCDKMPISDRVNLVSTILDLYTLKKEWKVIDLEIFRRKRPLADFVSDRGAIEHQKQIIRYSSGYKYAHPGQRQGPTSNLLYSPYKNQTWIFQMLHRYLEHVPVDLIRNTSLDLVVKMHLADESVDRIYNDFTDLFGDQYSGLITKILIHRNEIVLNTLYILDYLSGRKNLSVSGQLDVNEQFLLHLHTTDQQTRKPFSYGKLTDLYLDDFPLADLLEENVSTDDSTDEESQTTDQSRGDYLQDDTFEDTISIDDMLETMILTNNSSRDKKSPEKPLIILSGDTESATELKSWKKPRSSKETNQLAALIKGPTVPKSHHQFESFTRKNPDRFMDYPSETFDLPESKISKPPVLKPGAIPRHLAPFRVNDNEFLLETPDHRFVVRKAPGSRLTRFYDVASIQDFKYMPVIGPGTFLDSTKIKKREKSFLTELVSSLKLHVRLPGSESPESSEDDEQSMSVESFASDQRSSSVRPRSTSTEPSTSTEQLTSTDRSTSTESSRSAESSRSTEYFTATERSLSAESSLFSEQYISAGPSTSTEYSMFTEASTSAGPSTSAQYSLFAEPSTSAAAKLSMFASEPSTSAEPSSSDESMKVDYQWLIENCKMLPLTIYETLEEVAQSILECLTETSSVDHFVAVMCDLFGFEFFEFYKTIAEHRDQLTPHLATPQFSIENIPMKKEGSTLVIEESPALGPRMIVYYETDKRSLKEATKERKKLRKQQNRNSDRDDDFSEGTSETVSECSDTLRDDFSSIPTVSSFESVEAVSSLTHVYDSRKMINVGEFILPEGTTVNDTKEYTRVDLPALKSTEPLNDIVKCDPISYADLKSCNHWLEKMFANFEKLNLIQSTVFATAFHSNDNMLICAPTGAGKTNIALLTIARCLNLHSIEFEISDPNFKIVYIAPIKALAAEMTENFRGRLANTPIKVREYTGDIQLSPKQINETQILVSTPEKWDIVSRKIDSDRGLGNLVRLIIIDEIHLLNTDRGHVIEAIVARTLRLVESSQTMIRLVGLSATLPNYIDVAQFLRVPLDRGLFYFDNRFRAVPLETSFIGVTNINQNLDEICFNEVVNSLRNGHQVMVFVHTRRGTVISAERIFRAAQTRNMLRLFIPDVNTAGYMKAKSVVETSSFKEFRDLFPYGIAMHHAGVSRTDRNHVEKYFLDGYIRVLVTTSTLAWGVNLPAHTVIIKGTEMFAGGTTRDLDILDIQQIFGRAGRPQFDNSGHAVLITELAKLNNYLRLMNNNIPIESAFLKNLPDHLNAEVCLGTVATIIEAITWLHYTYLFIRMNKNPLVYGITYDQIADDPTLVMHRRRLIIEAGRKLQDANLLRVSLKAGNFVATDFGRIASQFYITYESMHEFLKTVTSKSVLLDQEAFQVIARASEFEQIRVREEEQRELELLNESCCFMPVTDITDVSNKVSILMQTYLSRKRIESSSLQSDLNYIMNCVPRLVRAVFEICLRVQNGSLAFQFLSIALMFENVQWEMETPFRQFHCLSMPVIDKIEERQLTVEQVRDMDVESIGRMIRHQKEGALLKKLADNFPYTDVDIKCYPITTHVLRAEISIYANFIWDQKIHGHHQGYHLWVENSDNNVILHHDFFTLACLKTKVPFTQLFMTIPLGEKPPTMLLFRVVNDRFLEAITTETIPLSNIILPKLQAVETDLLLLQPIRKSALTNSRFESITSFNYLNPIQTQMFHSVYHTDANILLGAPTGCGKTFIAELAIFRLINQQVPRKAIYIAPLKALVRERFQDWSERFGRIGINVIQCTGDATPPGYLLNKAQVIVATPEKWDVISRGWALRDYVRNVGLIIIDEIHLLGEERGPVIEAVIARANLIASNLSGTIRFVGLSATIAYCAEMASWLAVPPNGLFNFRHFVRPVTLEVHISGFPGYHYCPRMALMNKPTYQAIQDHAPKHPTIVFVSSRRQTRLTAMELISLLQRDDHENDHAWLRVPLEEMTEIVSLVTDETLKDSLLFGVGVHHAGLNDLDRKLVEHLFYEQKIQIIIATSTLAWGVNFPARLVVIKGTEFYDAKVGKYVDMPISDILQMMGRAGRPQFDTKGIAVVLVSENKKNFYKKFLFEPFPVESHMLEALPNHVLAETAAGAIKDFDDIYKYISWTYLYRRLRKNPTCYGLTATDEDAVHLYMIDLVNETVQILEENQCFAVDYGKNTVTATVPATIGARYYLQYQSVLQMVETLDEDLEPCEIMEKLSDMFEFAQVPVRHNEEYSNEDLAALCRNKPTGEDYFSSHAKTYILLQAHLDNLPMPCQDYVTDLKSVLEQTPRIIQAFVDYGVFKGWLPFAIRSAKLMAMFVQGIWFDESPLLQIPGITRENFASIQNILDNSKQPIPRTFPELVIEAKRDSNAYKLWLQECFFDLPETERHEITNYLNHIPAIHVQFRYNEINQPIMQVARPQSAMMTIRLKPETVYEISFVIHSLPPFSPNIYIKTKKKTRKIGFVVFIQNNESPEDSTNVVRATFTEFKRAQGRFQITSPKNNESDVYDLYFISDTYFGLDQHYMLTIQSDMAENDNLAVTEDEPLQFEQLTISSGQDPAGRDFDDSD